MMGGRDEDAFEALGGLLEAGCPCRVPVRGISMLPHLKEGDVLHLAPALPGQLRLGDLLAFRRGGHLIVHRFAGWIRLGQDAWLREKGDNLAWHGLVRPGDLVGRVAMVDSAKGRRSMSAGFGKWANRALGCRAWLSCVVREALRGVPAP